MRKILKRFFAYTIDMMVVILVAQSLSGIPAINKQLDDYNKYYNDYITLVETYGQFKVDLGNAFEDKELTKKEYQSLVDEHEEYVDILENAYTDQKLTEKEYNQISTVIDEEYQEEYKQIYYEIEKHSILYFVIYLVAVFAYFVGFNKLTGGQTLGKKLLRLKIVNAKDKTKEVPVWGYVIRAVILYQPIYYLVKLIGTQVMDINTYYIVTNVCYSIQYYLELLIIAMIIIRVDGRGLQDLLAKTRVVLLDREGNEVEDKFDVLVYKRVKERKQNKKIIDEEPIDESTEEK